MTGRLAGLTSKTREAFRQRIVRAARDWVGVPYAFGGRTKEGGCDCLGLILGVASEAGADLGPVPTYAPDWAVTGGAERLENALGALWARNDPEDARPGAVLLLRPRIAAGAHLGFLSAPQRMIHAYARRGVVESRLTPALSRTVRAVFLIAPTAGAPAFIPIEKETRPWRR